MSDKKSRALKHQQKTEKRTKDGRGNTHVDKYGGRAASRLTDEDWDRNFETYQAESRLRYAGHRR